MLAASQPSSCCRPSAGRPLRKPPAGGDFDWKPWRSLAVQDGGRQKPLDSLAWETWRMIGNRASLADPQSGQVLDATAMYSLHAAGLAGVGPTAQSASAARPWGESSPDAGLDGRMHGDVAGRRTHARQVGSLSLILVDSVELRSAGHEGRREIHRRPWISARRCCAILIPRRPLPFLSGHGVWRFARIRPFSPSRRRPSNWPAVSRLSRPSCRTKTRPAADPQQ